MLKTTLEVCSPQILIYWLHCSDFRMHYINDKVDTYVMLGMMVTSANVIRDVVVVVRTRQGWWDRTGSIQYLDIKSVLPRKYVKAALL